MIESERRRRGWVALSGGVLLVLLIVAVWIWIHRLLGSSPQYDEAAAQFLGKMNVAFGLIVLSGLLGMANGWIMAHSGRRNGLIEVGIVVAFGAGLIVAVLASGGYHPR